MADLRADALEAVRLSKLTLKVNEFLGQFVVSGASQGPVLREVGADFQTDTERVEGWFSELPDSSLSVGLNEDLASQLERRIQGGESFRDVFVWFPHGCTSEDFWAYFDAKYALLPQSNAIESLAYAVDCYEGLSGLGANSLRSEIHSALMQGIEPANNYDNDAEDAMEL